MAVQTIEAIFFQINAICGFKYSQPHTQNEEQNRYNPKKVVFIKTQKKFPQNITVDIDSNTHNFSKSVNFW